jgi:general stress protein YciG
MDLNPPQGTGPLRTQRCTGRTKAGKTCNAPAVKGGLCFFHTHPEKLAELGRQGGQKNRHWTSGDDPELANKILRKTGDVASLLEETINRVRQGPFDLRSANTIGFLAGILLKALDHSRIEERLSNLEAVTGNTDVGNTDAKESFEFKPLTESHHEQSPSSSENN